MLVAHEPISLSTTGVGDGGTIDGNCKITAGFSLFKWNAVHVVLAVLSLSLHADRYSAIL